MELTFSGDIDRFEKKYYEKPDISFQPLYLWMWNEVVTEERITNQLDMMKAQGAGSVWALPVPSEHRPESNPTNLKPEYLTDEFMDRFEFYVEEMQKRDMMVWLYDEGGWPSGSVCGRVVREDPSLGQQYLERQEIRPVYEDSFEVPEDCLAAFAFQGDRLLKRLEPGEAEEIIGRGGKYWPADDVRIEIYRAKIRETRNYYYPPYPDMLNPRTIEAFIRMTHERYNKRVKKYFGNVIPVIVSDEMNFGHNPVWTEGLLEGFKKDKGYDLADKLPSIFGGDSDKDQRVRIDFHDWCTRRFAESCATIQDWCRQHGVMFSGHLGPEDETLAPYLYGRNLMRVLRYHDIPGTDTIFRQIFPYPKASAEQDAAAAREAGISEIKHLNHYFPKYTSSVAHQEGYRRSFSESFAVYGSGLSFEEMKWVMDFQYVRGINLYIHSAVYLANNEHYMGANTRPILDEKNPIVKHMNVFNGYMARLSYLMSIGEPGIDTAVYYPARDFFADVPDLKEVQTSHERLVQILLENQCDFDLVDDDILLRSKVRGGVLEAGKMKYKRVFVAQCRWLHEDSRKKLEELSRGGGEFHWMVHDGFDGLENRLTPMVLVEPRNSWIRVCRRDTDNGRIYFITNEDPDEGKQCKLIFTEENPVARLDVETGAVYRPAGAVKTGRGWEIPVDIPVAGSDVFIFSDEELGAVDEPEGAGEEIKVIRGSVTVRKVRSYRIGEHELEVEDVRDDRESEGQLGDWGDALGADFSGDAEYRIVFDCSKEEVQQTLFLDLGKVRVACEVNVNGTPLGKRLWRPFTFSVAGLLKEGENEVRVTVTNTMANQFAANTKVFEKWPARIFTTYYARSLYFEKQSTASGLYGPVRLLR